MEEKGMLIDLKADFAESPYEKKNIFNSLTKIYNLFVTKKKSLLPLVHIRKW